MATRDANDFYAVLNAAIAEIAETGFDNPERIAFWQRKLKEAAQNGMRSQEQMKKMLNQGLVALYKKLVEDAGVLKLHPGVATFTLNRIKPELRKTLDQYMMSSFDLIRLNRESTIAKMQQRFAGWASSVPADGLSAQGKKQAQKSKEGIKKGVAGLKFEERRVLIDQGHKFTAAVNRVVAAQGNAIACIWHSKFRQVGYDYRDKHKDRELESIKLPYVVRGNWAMEKGLMKLGGSKYIEDMTQPGEEPFCGCHVQYLYSLRQLPDAMLTAKGRSELERVKALRNAA